ncbi:protein-glucosylgalactosylhydroxylysine glucosidase [Aplysia californica]|uniref:Protein-glucosylgalactosylhydroxylysine glucosidase n=1 Tax=Aplysia californica TaxID=6500 RepID=A0ABM1AEG8_APLCA|nr:protein-glucosylgalactosylhydroxylysine glucosidase [Aplysia californica]
MNFPALLSLFSLISLGIEGTQRQVNDDSQAPSGIISRPGISDLPRVSVPEDATVIKSKRLPKNMNYMTEVGNGHIATTLKGHIIFMNGLFNGNNDTSHRARIQTTVNYDVNATVPAGMDRTFILDMGRATFTERYEAADVNISLRTYAHRKLDRILVVELEMSRDDPSQEVSATVSLDQGPISVDTDFIGESEGVKHFRTKEAEFEEIAPRTDFYVKASRFLRGKIRMGAGKTSETFLAITAIGVDRARVIDEFKKAVSLFHSGNLLSTHVQEWSDVWNRGRVDVEGDVSVARLNYGAFYYIFSSLPFYDDKSWPFIGLSPGGLAHGIEGKDYYGHIFWDQSTWMYPGVAMFHSDLGRIIAQTRTRTLNSSKIEAAKEGYEGAKYAWESAYTGLETCPAKFVSDHEIHITADVSFMMKQYWQLTNDLEFMAHMDGAEVVREAAKFWMSRSTYNPEVDTYSINTVMGPDEYHYPVNNSVYTNSIVAINLRFANKISKILGLPVEPKWEQLASKLVIPYDAVQDYHPEFEGYTLPDQTKQADTVLLNFPLMVDMKPSTMENDLRFYEQTTPKVHAPAMTWGVFLLGWLQLGNETKAAQLFSRSTRNAQQPFLVWTEDADGRGATNFLTGMGGYLQSLIFGYGGCRIYDDRLTFDPKMIPGTTRVKFSGLDYRGCSYDLHYDENNVTITLRTFPPGSAVMQVKWELKGSWQIIQVDLPVTVSRQKLELRRVEIDGGVIGKRLANL